MFKKLILGSTCLALCLLMLHSSGYSQAYAGKNRIKGTVTDETGAPLEGVRVKLFHESSASGLETKTDSHGRWEANFIRGGQWRLDFTKTGYESRRDFAVVSEAGKTLTGTTILKKVEGLVMSDDLMKLLDEANALFDKGQIDEARVQFEKLLLENPEAYILNINIGNCFFKKEDYDQAISCYLKVLDKNPQYVKALIALGNAYTNKDDNDKAMEYYAKIDSSQVDDVDILYNIGVGYYKGGKPAEALKYFQRAVELDSSYTDGLYYLGLTQLNLQDNPAAIATFENYLKVDGDSERAAQVKSFLDYLRKK